MIINLQARSILITVFVTTIINHRTPKDDDTDAKITLNNNTHMHSNIRPNNDRVPY